jgi:hypothetical protein
MLSQSLIALGCGAFGVLAGLFIGFAPEPHLAALRRARRGTTASLREGDFVYLEGVLTALEPIRGPVSQEAVATFEVAHYRLADRQNKERLVHLERSTAPGLTVRDQAGSAQLLLDEGVFRAARSVPGTETTLKDRWSTVVFAPDVVELAEHSIALGSNVLAMGQAARVGDAWTLGGRDAFLTDIALETLLSDDRQSRILGGAVISLSLVGSLFIAWTLRA